MLKVPTKSSKLEIEMIKTTKKPKDALCKIDIDSMSLSTLCKWQALRDAVNIIADKCDDRKIDFNTVNIKPLDVLDFIEHKADAIEHKITTTNEFELLKSPGINIYG